MTFNCPFSFIDLFSVGIWGPGCGAHGVECLLVGRVDILLLDPHWRAPYTHNTHSVPSPSRGAPFKVLVLFANKLALLSQVPKQPH